MKSTILLLCLMPVLKCHASTEVLDLGTIGIEAKQRGPDVQIIDPNMISRNSAARLLSLQLKEMEKSLLQPVDPPAENHEDKP